MGIFEDRIRRRLEEMNKAVKEKKPVIGFDFGNCNSYLCFIPHYDMEKGRLGGAVQSLLPAKWKDGIPSVFFYANSDKCKKDAEKNKKPLPWSGVDAVRMVATPYKNRKRLLKRHLGEHFTLDDRSFSYDDAIVQVVEHCIRTANKILKEKMMVTTNLVSLSYPATYTCAQRERLIELVERATLEDGKTHVKVFGTITEPASAALDYLADCAKKDSDTTVLTYDLGGGTFDLALVSAYPKGRKNASGETYYYDIVNARGIENLGGAEFDEVVYQLLLKKIGKTLNEEQQSKVRNLAESVKIDLSENEITYPMLEGIIDDEIEITRKEFENASTALIKKTIDATQKMLADHKNQAPEMILLTGGASQMPIIKKELEKAFPQYKGKVQIFRPSEAIACGAARFGTVEMTMDMPDPNQTEGRKTSIIQQRVIYDIGVRMQVSTEDKTIYILQRIAAGTPIPYEGKRYRASTTYDTTRLKYAVFEANKQNPDKYKIKEDYTEIMTVFLEFGRLCPPMTPSEYRLSIDALGRLTIEAWDISKPDSPPVKCFTELKNLSKGGS